MAAANRAGDLRKALDDYHEMRTLNASQDDADKVRKQPG